MNAIEIKAFIPFRIVLGVSLTDKNSNHMINASSIKGSYVARSMYVHSPEM